MYVWNESFTWSWEWFSTQHRKFLMILGVVFYKVDFLHLDKCQSLIKVDLNISGIKVSYKLIPSLLMDIMKHSQITESNKFAISLQYLKKVGAEFIFCMQINFKVSASLHYRFWWKFPDMTKVLKIRSL